MTVARPAFSATAPWRALLFLTLYALLLAALASS